jgi:hypothetical protein
MLLEKQLEKEKTAIVKEWFDMVVSTYPADTSQFLKLQKDPFANPVGNTLLKGLEALFQELLNGLNPESVESFLDPMIRIRAVQPFTPSQATGFISYLKIVLRKRYEKQLEDSQIAKALAQFELKIDALYFMAFDIYMQCREAIYRIQANEEKNSTLRALKRAGLLNDCENQ